MWTTMMMDLGADLMENLASGEADNCPDSSAVEAPLVIVNIVNMVIVMVVMMMMLTMKRRRTH